MARMDADWDALAKEFKMAEARLPGILKKALLAAAKVYEEATRDEISAKDVWRSGALWWSIKTGHVTHTADGLLCEVWPQGTRTDRKHPHGERNETIGFVLEYTDDAPAYMAPAAVKAEPKAYETMENILKEVWPDA